MADLVREGGFKIVGAWRAVCRKLQLSSVLSLWSWIDAHVGLSDGARFRIEEYARAASGGFKVERFVFSCWRDCDQVYAVAGCGWTDGSDRRSRHDEVDIRQTGPTHKSAVFCA